MNPTSCLFGSRFVYNPFFFWAGVLLFVEKTCQRAALFWFELPDVGILQIFHSRAVIQRIIVNFPAFSEHGSAEKRSWFVPIQIVIRTSRRLDLIFCTKQRKTEVFSNIQN
jgi:hypothetical protein